MQLGAEYRGSLGNMYMCHVLYFSLFNHLSHGGGRTEADDRADQEDMG